MIIYTLSNCSTCRAATRWLTEHGIRHEERAIRETPPSPSELRIMLAAYAGDLRRLFNTAGQDFRAAKLDQRLPVMTPAEGISLLHADGRLVKRRFLIGDGVARVGFKPEEWSAALLRG